MPPTPPAKRAPSPTPICPYVPPKHFYHPTLHQSARRGNHTLCHKARRPCFQKAGRHSLSGKAPIERRGETPMKTPLLLAARSLLIGLAVMLVAGCGSKAAKVDDERLVAADANAEWLSYGKGYSEQ